MPAKTKQDIESKINQELRRFLKEQLGEEALIWLRESASKYLRLTKTYNPA